MLHTSGVRNIVSVTVKECTVWFSYTFAVTRKMKHGKLASTCEEWREQVFKDIMVLLGFMLCPTFDFKGREVVWGVFRRSS